MKIRVSACVLALLLAGCASSLTDLPPGANALRCTEYSGTTSPPLAGTSIRADGCQCMSVGEGIRGEVTMQLATCSVTVRQ